MTRVGRGGADAEDAYGEEMPAELARQFLGLPQSLAVLYNARARPWRPAGPRHYARDLATGEEAEGAAG